MNTVLEFVGGVFALILIVIWVITIMDLFHRHLGAGKTAAWLLLVIIVPFLGAILYWALRTPPEAEVQRAYDDERAFRESAARRPADSSFFGP